VLCREIGKPVVEVYGGELLPTLRALAWLERHAGPALAPQRLRRFPSSRMLEWEPYGVVGLISPWNYPLFLTLPIIAAALAAGNTVLWKPSELALAASQAVFGVIQAAGLAEVVRMLPGGPALGEAVVDAGCDKYVLVGSARTGRRVLERLGSRLTPAVAELSGVDPMIVCGDADVETAARSAAWARVSGAGQTCMSPRRLLVHEGVYPRFLEACREVLRSVRLGDPEDPRTELGPLRTEELRRAAAEAVEEAVAGGARRLCGGRPCGGTGFYLQPALLADCEWDMRAFREDLFAPVLAVRPVRSVEEAVEAAKNSPYALTASVWTRSRARGREIARALRGGVVSVNDVLLPGADPETPFGGSGASGYGRTRGEAGLREMVRPRVADEGPAEWVPRRHLFPYRPGTLSILSALTAREAAGGTLERLRTVGRLYGAVRRFGKGEA
jgi:acyl-CoA reductase-like NAD-dependent aldehyde dehydrogenase